LSRIEELRKKFQEKGRAAVAEVTSARGQFVDALHRFTERTYAASSWDKDFEDALFKRFEAEAPNDRIKWLASVTHDLFRSAIEPPVWVGEVDWCFHEGAPLEFLTQFSDEKGVTFYVFRGFNKEKRTFFKMRAWDRDSRIILTSAIGG
jgi:hypothetical protein